MGFQQRRTPRTVTAPPVGTLWTQSLAGTLTPAGALTKTVPHGKAGTITPVGALKKAVTQFQRTGTLTPTGALGAIRLVVQALAGTITPGAGAGPPTPVDIVWENLVNVTATGSQLEKTAGTHGSEDAGATSSQIITTLPVDLVFSVHRLARILYVGISNQLDSDTASANLDYGFKFDNSNQVWAWGPASSLLYFMAGDFADTDVFTLRVETDGTVYWLINGTATGYEPPGTMPATPLVADVSMLSANALILSATLTMGSGSAGPNLIKTTLKALAGTITSAGALIKAATRGLAGTVTPVGTLASVKSGGTTFTGTLTPTGALSHIKGAVKALAGTITPTGALVRSTLKTLVGTITPAGVVTQQARLTKAGTITPTGTLGRVAQRVKAFTGTLTPTGALSQFKVALQTLAGTLSFGSASDVVDSFPWSDGALPTVSGGLYAKPSDWPNPIAVASHLAKGTASGDNACYLPGWSGSTVAQWASVTVSTFDDYCGPTVFNSTVGDYYFMDCRSSEWYFYEVHSNQVFNSISFSHSWTGGAPTAGDVLRLEVVISVTTGNPVLTAFRNGVSIGTQEDSSRKRMSGVPGLRIWNTTTRFSAFQAGTIGGGGGPGGLLIKQAQKALTATITPAGAVLKAASRVLAGTITPTGTVGRSLQVVRTLIGTLTPTGTVTSVKVAVKTLAGTLTPVGALAKSLARGLSGLLTPTGALARAYAAVRAFAGTLTPTGTVASPHGGSQSLAGTLTPTGALTQIKVAVKSLAGTITPVGGLAKLFTQFHRTGAIAPAGVLARSAAKGLSGLLTPTGALARLLTAFKGLAGTLSPTGALVRTKVTVQAFAGTLTSTGALRRTVAKGLAGTITSAGVVRKTVGRSLTATLVPTGAVVIKFFTQFHRTGTLTPTGTLVRLKVIVRSMAGTLTSTGALTRAMGKALRGTVTPLGHRITAVAKILTGRITPTGLVGTHQSGPAIVIITTVLPPAVAGVSYSATLATSGGVGARVFGLVGGTLPPGLSLSPDGVISGIPQLVAPFAPALLPDAVTGVPYSQPLTLGATSYTFTVGVIDSAGTSDTQGYTVGLSVGPATWTLVRGTLPVGLTLDPSTGALTGTPALVGTLTPGLLPPIQSGQPYQQALTIVPGTTFYQFTVRATTNGLSTDHDYQLFLSTDPAVYGLVAGVLPTGLSLSPNGVIAGTAVGGTMGMVPATLPPATVDVDYQQWITVAGTPSVSYPITIRATTHGQTVDQAYTLEVLTWDTTTRPTVFLRRDGTIPACVVLRKDGLLSGPPMGVGTWTFTIRARDTAGHTLDTFYTFTVTS